MNNERFDKLCLELKEEIKKVYGFGVTLEEAEKLAAKFLHAQFEVSEQLKSANLNSRMRKSGIKSIRAAVYLEAATKTEKKPSDTYLDALVNSDKLVSGEQEALDTSEVLHQSLQNYFDIFKEGHIFFRGVAKGRFE